MKTRIGFTAISIFPILAVLLFSFSAHAGTRTVYFDQSAVASSLNGYKTQQTAKCRIVVSNPSSQDQKVTISLLLTSSLSTVTPTTIVAGSRSTTINPSAPDFTGGTTTTPWVYTINPLSHIAGSNSKTYDFLFDPFPLYDAASNIGKNADQQLSCRGNITVEDSSPTLPGFIVANGMILTFSEASASQTMGSTSNTTAYVGSAVYTQIPISVNGGKPF